MSVARIYNGMTEAGARRYRRERDLPGLFGVSWPRTLDAKWFDPTRKGTLKVLALLRRALRGERRRGLADHWSYDLGRHVGLLSAFKAELARYKQLKAADERAAQMRAGNARAFAELNECVARFSVQPARPA